MSSYKFTSSCDDPLHKRLCPIELKSIVAILSLIFLQMLPLIKKSTDNLVEVIGEKAAAEESFEVLKCVHVYRQEFISKNLSITILKL